MTEVASTERLRRRCCKSKYSCHTYVVCLRVCRWVWLRYPCACTISGLVTAGLLFAPMAECSPCGGTKRARDNKSEVDVCTGRKRRVPHAEGRWSCLAYLPVPEAFAADISEALQPIMSAMTERHGIQWHSMLNTDSTSKHLPHVSLTMPLFVWRDELPAVRSQVRSALHPAPAAAAVSKSLTLSADTPVLLPGGNGSITFIGAALSPHAAGVVKRLIARCDAQVASLGLPPYHQVSYRPQHQV